MLIVDSLTRAVAATTIVADVSFTMAAGDVVTILGPSGSGKTALLRMIAGSMRRAPAASRCGAGPVSVPGGSGAAPRGAHSGCANSDWARTFLRAGM